MTLDTTTHDHLVATHRAMWALGDYALMADTNTLMASLRRGTYNDVFARLDPGTQAAQEQFKAALKSNPALSVDVETEADNINRNLKNPTRFYAFLAYAYISFFCFLAGLGTIHLIYIIVRNKCCRECPELFR